MKDDKNGKENTQTVTYRLEFIDSTRLMANSSSNLVNELPEAIHKIKSEYKPENNKM